MCKGSDSIQLSLWVLSPLLPQPDPYDGERISPGTRYSGWFCADLRCQIAVIDSPPWRCFIGSINAGGDDDRRLAYYCISSSARSSDCRMVMQSTFAGLRLITGSNRVGCSTGMSAGLAPLSILST